MAFSVRILGSKRGDATNVGTQQMCRRSRCGDAKNVGMQHTWGGRSKCADAANVGTQRKGDLSVAVSLLKRAT